MSENPEAMPSRAYKALVESGMKREDALRFVNAGAVAARMRKDLRDDFAAQFMAAIIASGSSISIADDDIGLQQVRVAYALADTMLRVRDEEVKS